MGSFGNRGPRRSVPERSAGARQNTTPRASGSPGPSHLLARRNAGLTFESGDRQAPSSGGPTFSAWSVPTLWRRYAPIRAYRRRERDDQPVFSWPSFIVSILALAVSAGALWRTRPRKADLQIVGGEPTAYGGWVEAAASGLDLVRPLMYLRLPVVVENKGTVIGVVHNLRLVPDGGTDADNQFMLPQEFKWDGMDAAGLEAGGRDDRFACPFDVPGNGVRTVTARFRAELAGQFTVDQASTRAGTAASALGFPVRVDLQTPDGEWHNGPGFMLWLTRGFFAGWENHQQWPAALEAPRWAHWNENT